MLKKIHTYLIGLTILFLFILAFCVVFFLRRITIVDIDQSQNTETTTSASITTSEITTGTTTCVATKTTTSSSCTTSANDTTTSSDTAYSYNVEPITVLTTVTTVCRPVETTAVATNNSADTTTPTTHTSDCDVSVITKECQTQQNECSTCTQTFISETQQSSMQFVKTFSRGTYYCYGRGNIRGGSGRWLIDCSVGDGVVKGSIACRYIYEHYGYKHNERTMVYLESPNLPCLTGYYYVDDCCASNNTIDFYYGYASNCPFEMQGVVKNIDCYIVL